MRHNRTFTREEILSYTRDPDGTIRSILLRTASFPEFSRFRLVTFVDDVVHIRELVAGPGPESATTLSRTEHADWGGIPFSFNDDRSGMWHEGRVAYSRSHLMEDVNLRPPWYKRFLSLLWRTK